jgi:hypothetical protein
MQRAKKEATHARDELENEIKEAAELRGNVMRKRAVILIDRGFQSKEKRRRIVEKSFSAMLK